MRIWCREMRSALLRHRRPSLYLLESTDILGSASIYLTSFSVTGRQHVTGAKFLEVFLSNACLETKASELRAADPGKELYIGRP